MGRAWQSPSVFDAWSGLAGAAPVRCVERAWQAPLRFDARGRPGLVRPRRVEEEPGAYARARFQGKPISRNAPRYTRPNTAPSIQKSRPLM